jgi:hypothetical protein
LGLVLVAFSIPEAYAFKARYYKECYEPVDQVEDLVADQSDNAKNIETAGKVAGALGSFGGFGGFGGFGKAASTASKVAKYSAYVSDAMAFADQMKDDHPDPNARFAVYGDHLTKEAEDLAKVEEAVGKAQLCYAESWAALGADVRNEELKERKAKRQHKEIRKGATAIGDVLLKALKRVNQNIDSYDKAPGARRALSGS